MSVSGNADTTNATLTLSHLIVHKNTAYGVWISFSFRMFERGGSVDGTVRLPCWQVLAEASGLQYQVIPWV